MATAAQRWSNDHPNPCIMCDPFIGSVWAIDDPLRPNFPIHLHCRCTWTNTNASLNRPHWTDIPEDSRRQWQRWGNWLARNNWPIPPFLLPLLENDDMSLNANQPITIKDGRFRLAATTSADRPEFLASLITAGRIRNADNSPGPITISAEVLQDALMDGMFEGLAVYVDHAPNGNNPSLKTLVAVAHSPTWNTEEQSIDATIRFYSRDHNELSRQLAAVLRDMLSDSASGIPTPDIGLSLVFWPEFAQGEQHPIPLARIRKIDSVDLVSTPAAYGRIKAALSAAYPIGGIMPKKVEEEVHDPDETAVTEETSTAQRQQAPPPESPEPGSPATPTNLSTSVDKWQAAVAQTAVPALLAAADLPQASRERLAKQQFTSPDALEAAIAQERAYLAQLVEERVIRIGGHAPRGAISGMKTGLDVARNAVDWLFGVEGAETPPPQLRSVDVFYTMLTGDFEFHGQPYPERMQFSGATTGTLPSMAANAMNKVVTAQFSHLSHYRWFERIVAVEPNDGSVQEMRWTTFGGIQNLPVVSEKAPYTELEVADVHEADPFVKRGGYVGITLEMIRNSQIQRIRGVPRALAIAAIRSRSSAVSSIFTLNSGVGPTLSQDSTALFHADHNNVATTALGSDATAWRAARAECYRHQEVGSEKALAVYPRYWIGPAELYDQALSIFGYGEGMPTTYSPEAESRGFADPRAIPLVSPDFTDTNNWAYLVDPMVYPVIQMSYAQAPGGNVHPAPELWSAVAETGGLLFTNDVIAIKVRDWFAVGVNGPRGIGKRNVA